MIFFFATLGLFLFLIASIVISTLKNGISPMPTSAQVRKRVFEHLPALEKGNIVDLGSGWGHLLFPLSRRYPSCKIIGYENSLLPYLFSSFLNYHCNIKVKKRNFFKEPLCEVNLVICYLFPKGMERLKEKLQKELPSGALVISVAFAISGWEPTKVVRVKDLYQTPIYFYEQLLTSSKQ